MNLSILLLFSSRTSLPPTDDDSEHGVNPAVVLHAFSIIILSTFVIEVMKHASLCIPLKTFMG